MAWRPNNVSSRPAVSFYTKNNDTSDSSKYLWLFFPVESIFRKAHIYWNFLVRTVSIFLTHTIKNCIHLYMFYFLVLTTFISINYFSAYVFQHNTFNSSGWPVFCPNRFFCFRYELMSSESPRYTTYLPYILPDVTSSEFLPFDFITRKVLRTASGDAFRWFLRWDSWTSRTSVLWKERFVLWLHIKIVIYSLNCRVNAS